MSAGLWTVVLAGGAGRRLASVTGGIPKQYWSAGGAPSLLEQTLERTAPLCPPNRTVTVVDRSHRAHLEALEGASLLGTVVYQPQDRGTAAGVLLGLRTVLERDPDAIVLLTPADHGVRQPREFRRGIRMGEALVRSEKADIVLFGVEPDGPTGDYGWITAGDRLDGRSRGRRVAAFVEKPAVGDAALLLASGAVWNTMVLVARGQTLLGKFRHLLPGLAATFATAAMLSADRRERFLAEHYPLLASADFSRDLLSHADNLTLLVWPASMGWSDLGTPERMVAWCGGGRDEAPAPIAAAAAIEGVA